MIFIKLRKFFCRRAVIIAAVVLGQLLLIFAALTFFAHRSPIIGALLRMLTVSAAFFIVSQSHNPAYKIAWLMLMLLLPEAGGAIYLIGGNKKMPQRLKCRLGDRHDKIARYLLQEKEMTSGMAAKNLNFYPISRYLKRSTGFPAWENTSCKFFANASLLFENLCSSLERAERFIFMEYFIVADGALWERIEKILVDRIADGVEVRFMYDDVGCIDAMSPGLPKRIIEMGGQAVAFNRCRPRLCPAVNYRDHRKICVIDGDIGFCGGANISDEYVNLLPNCSHWKDSGVMLNGEGVWNLTMMFIELWDFSHRCSTPLQRYVPTKMRQADGSVQPFGDSPLDELCTAETVTMMGIMRAKRCCYITTPYLIPDCEMIKALTSAALSGVDIRIVTPAVPDKWYVHAVSRSFYRELLGSGVRIYEYSPGFIHSKQMVCDDEFAVVGTANMDFRSFYLHFEAAVCIYGGSAVSEVKDDFIHLFDCSRELTYEETFRFPVCQRIAAAVLKPFASLF